MDGNLKHLDVSFNEPPPRKHMLGWFGNQTRQTAASLGEKSFFDRLRVRNLTLETRRCRGDRNFYDNNTLQNVRQGLLL